MTSTMTIKESPMHAKKGGPSIQPTQHNYAFNIRNYVNLSRLIIMSVTLMFFLGGSYYALFLTPKYQATVYLSSKIYASLSASALSIDKVIPVDDKDTSAPRQLALMQTPQILRQLIDKLQLDNIVTSSDTAIAITELSLGEFTVTPNLFDIPIYVTVVDKDTYQLIIPYLSFEKKGTVGKSENYLISKDYSVKIKVDKIPATKGLTYTLKKEPKGKVVEKLLDNLVFEADGYDSKLVTNIITVNFTDMSPTKAALVANTLAQLAVEDSKIQEKEQAQNAVTLMEAERDHILDQLNRTGTKLAMLSTKFAHVAFDEKIYGKQFADELTNLDKSIAEAHAQLSMISTNVTDKHPQYQEAAAVYQSYVKKRDDYDQVVQASVGQGNSFLDYQRDLTVYTALYEDVSKNLQQFAARLKEPVGDLRVIELACIPDTPSSLSQPLIIALSALVGLICGYIAALVFD